MRPSLALALAAMALTTPSAAAPALRLLRLDAGLRSAGERTVEAGGEVAALQVLPGGGVAAVVVAGGAASLLRLDPAGAAQRTPLALPGTARATWLAPDDTLVVLAGQELLRLRAGDGHVLARRRLPFSPGEGAAVATAQGAWIALPGRLVHARLDGRDAERPLSGNEGGIEAQAWLLAIPDGGCLVAEQRFERHEVPGRPGNPDLTISLALTLLGPGGEVRGERRLGEARTRREWFWREAGARDSLLPGPMGLTRTRHEGQAAAEALAGRPGGGFAVLLWEGWGAGAERRSLVLLGPDLAVAATAERPRLAPRAGADGAPARLAMGAGAGGGWLLVEY